MPSQLNRPHSVGQLSSRRSADQTGLSVLIFALQIGALLWSSVALADRSELGLGLDARYGAPLGKVKRSIDSLGVDQPSRELMYLTQLGLTPRWTIGAGLGWGYEHQEADDFIEPSGFMCPEDQACRARTIVWTTHSATLSLRLSYTPLDWLSPTMWGEVGAWRRWRAEAHEQLSEGPSALIAHRFGQETWWGHSLRVGGGLYWRFLSRWSTVIGLHLQREQVLNPSASRDTPLSLGVSFWLSYHHYVRLF